MAGKIIVITGPTATGKSALATKVAKQIGGEIVSCDSMQIYRGMDIGTAKVTTAEMGGVPHHMIDVVSPNESYSVARYQEDAIKVIEDIISRGKAPILVGGTGLYIDAVLYPMQFREFDPAIRQQVQILLETHGKQALYDKLVELNPTVAARLSVNDVKRVGRALEIALAGETHSTDDLSKTPRYDAQFYVMAGDRKELYDRIDKRVEHMFDEGLVGEVKGLLEKGISPACQAFQAIAYKELFQHFDGQISLDEAVKLIQKRSRNYAKRQLTWMRRYPAVWLDYHDENVDLVVLNYQDPTRYMPNEPIQC